MRKTTLSWAEAATVAALCFGLFTGFSVQALLDGFPPARITDDGNAAVVGLELVLAGLALLYLHRRGFDIRSLAPRPTWPDSVLGLLLCALCWLAAVIAMQLFHTPGQADSVAFSSAGVSTTSLVLLSVVNGSYEEVFLLGVLARGLRGFGLSVAIGLPLLVRMLYHVYQGPLGVVAILAVGLVQTLGYVVTGRLWPSVLAHVLLDLTALL